MLLLSEVLPEHTRSCPTERVACVVKRVITRVALLGFILFGAAGCGLLPGVQPGRGSASGPDAQTGLIAAWDATPSPRPCPSTPVTTEQPPNQDAADPSGGEIWFRSPDGQIWASAWSLLHQDTSKVLWIRPRGTTLRVQLRRLDSNAPPLQVALSPGYELADYQSSSIVFPTKGCWEVEAQAGATDWRFVVDVR